MVLKNSFILAMVVLFMVCILSAVVNGHHDNRIMDNLFQVFPVISVFLSISLCILNDVPYTETFTMSCIGYEFCALYLVLCVMSVIRRVYSVLYFFEILLFIEYIIYFVVHVYLIKSTSVLCTYFRFGAVDYFHCVKSITILSLNGVAGFY